jgi:hypothetical protein
MENSTSRILTGSVVKRTLKNMKENPERSIRNLVDMALQFTSGRFQQDFFATAQTMLQNENSAYYRLVRDIVSHADTDRLYTFGMNLGYNGCTTGAQRIRENEKKLNCNIPWTVAIQIDAEQFEEKEQQYQATIQTGEKLGIYVWILFCMEQPQKSLLLAKNNPDSAFFLFCEPEDLTSDFLDDATELYNLMLVVRCDENASSTCANLRNLGLLYSVWYQYGQKDTETIINGDLFYCGQQPSPIFFVLLPNLECPDVVQHLAHQAVQQARKEQSYHTMLWELQGDNSLIDAIISDDTCSVYFNMDGNLCGWHKEIKSGQNNLFQNNLTDIFVSACPKKV